MVIIPPGHYVLIDDPVVVEDKQIVCPSLLLLKLTSFKVFDDRGQAQVRPGNQEIRFEQPPFVLYPGEKCGLFLIFILTLFKFL